MVVILKGSILLWMLPLFLSFLLILRGGKAKKYLIKICIGILFGILVCIGQNSSRQQFFPVDSRRVKEFTCAVIKDSAVYRQNKTRIDIHITQVTDTGDAVYSANFKCRLFLQGRHKYYAGQIMQVSSPGQLNSEFLSIQAIYNNISYSGWTNPLLSFRSEIKKSIDMRIPESEAIHLWKALVLADKDDLENGTLEIFRRAGIAHLLALSGMHLHFICLILQLLFAGKLPKKTVFGIICTFICVYIFIAGPVPSLLRGASFWFFLNLSSVFRLGWKPLKCLSLACLSLIIIIPDIAASVSFIFSVSAVLGIFLISPFINFILSKYIPIIICGPLSVGIGAFLAGLPVQSLLWGEAALGGIIATIILSPLIAFVMASGFLTVVMPACVADLFHVMLKTVYGWIIETARYFSMFRPVPVHPAVCFSAVLSAIVIINLYALLKTGRCIKKLQV